MSDLAETYTGMKEAKREKRASNRESGAALLTREAIPFEERNHGRHLLVNGGPLGVIDYWPGTGRWIARFTGKNGRGVKGLLRHIKTSCCTGDANGL